MKIIRNGILITPEGPLRGDLAFDQGKIIAVGLLPPAEVEEEFDASGCWVFPGFIDQHTHLQANTGISWTADDFASGTTAAVCGGTTTLVDFATQDKGGTLREALDIWKARSAGVSRCNYAFHMAICDWNEQTRAEIPQIICEGVNSFKVYMAYDHLMVSDAELLEIMECMRRNGGLLGCHCENGAMIKALQKKAAAKGQLSPAAHPLTRPPEAEAEAINRFLHLAALADCPVYVVHLSSRLGLEEIRAARKRGQTLYVESCPQYMIMDDSVYAAPGFEGAKYVCSPPLRKKEDIKVLREALLDGEINAIATDHCSFDFEGQKTMGREDFRKIPNGMPGIEHRPALVSTILAREVGRDPERMNQLLAEGPAKLMGMFPRKGALSVGSDADITVWNPEKKWVIRAEDQHQKVDYTPFEGMQVQGQARLVFVNGQLAAENGEPKDIIAGSYIKR